MKNSLLVFDWHNWQIGSLYCHKICLVCVHLARLIGVLLPRSSNARWVAEGARGSSDAVQPFRELECNHRGPITGVAHILGQLQTNATSPGGEFWPGVPLVWQIEATSSLAKKERKTSLFTSFSKCKYKCQDKTFLRDIWKIQEPSHLGWPLKMAGEYYRIFGNSWRALLRNRQEDCLPD